MARAHVPGVKLLWLAVEQFGWADRFWYLCGFRSDMSSIFVPEGVLGFCFNDREKVCICVYV